MHTFKFKNGSSVPFLNNEQTDFLINDKQLNHTCVPISLERPNKVWHKASAWAEHKPSAGDET